MTPVRVLSGGGQDAAPDFKTVTSFLGYGKVAPDPKVENLIRDCIGEITSYLSCSCAYAFVDVERDGEDVLNLGFGEIKSRNLARHLAKCNRALLFAASVGTGADRYIAASSARSSSKSVIADAVASASIEAWCDRIESMLLSGMNTVYRFSAGYGDFDISWQREILKYLNASVRAGIYTTDALMMLPTKSVTAIVGITAG